MAKLIGSKCGLLVRAVQFVIIGISFSVFAVLDIVDQMLCPVFAVLDSLLDGTSKTCYCRNTGLSDVDIISSCISPLVSSTQESKGEQCSGLERWRISSDTVCVTQRRAKRRRLRIVPLCSVDSREDRIALEALDDTRRESKVAIDAEDSHSSPALEHELRQRSSVLTKVKSRVHRRLSWIRLRSCKDQRLERWSDCGCDKCTSWRVNDQQLYIHVDDRDFVASPGIDRQIQRAENNVIFLHGFLSSSSFWTNLVMPSLPQDVRASHRLFAMDILGFGKSPKPSNCFYTLADHVDIIQRSLLQPHGIQKFHLVAHSMGCIVALALASQFPAAVKSITLLAPPYFPATPGISPGISTMQQVAPRRIWPMSTFGTAVMSWYEHIGRLVCLIICRNHRIWEPVLNIIHSKIPGHRIPLSSLTDFTQHTHHSAWHLFHNTICSGAHATDYCFEVLLAAGRRVRVIHGTLDSVVPFKQSEKMSRRHPNVLLSPVLAANHRTIVFGRESELGLELAEEFKFAEGSLN